MPHHTAPASVSAPTSGAAFALDRRTLLAALLPAGLLTACASAPFTAPVASVAAPPAAAAVPPAGLGAMRVVGWSAHRLA
jgi:hypothetical protein